MGNISVHIPQIEVSTKLVTENSHGLTMPAGHSIMAVYRDTTTGNLIPADATNATKQKMFFVTNIVDANTLELQTTGFATVTAHGYTIGQYYYVSDVGNGGFTITPPAVGNDIAFSIFDVDTLVLIDNRRI